MSLVTWILTPEEAQTVVNIVAKLPYDQVSGLIEKLVVQARNSQQPQTAQTVPQAEFVQQIGDNLAAAHGYNNEPLPAGWNEADAR